MIYFDWFLNLDLEKEILIFSIKVLIFVGCFILIFSISLDKLSVVITKVLGLSLIYFVSSFFFNKLLYLKIKIWF